MWATYSWHWSRQGALFLGTVGGVYATAFPECAPRKLGFRSPLQGGRLAVAHTELLCCLDAVSTSPGALPTSPVNWKLVICTGMSPLLNSSGLPSSDSSLQLCCCPPFTTVMSSAAPLPGPQPLVPGYLGSTSCVHLALCWCGCRTRGGQSVGKILCRVGAYFSERRSPTGRKFLQVGSVDMCSALVPSSMQFLGHQAETRHLWCLNWSPWVRQTSFVTEFCFVVLVSMDPFFIGSLVSYLFSNCLSLKFLRYLGLCFYGWPHVAFSIMHARWLECSLYSAKFLRRFASYLTLLLCNGSALWVKNTLLLKRKISSCF